MKFLMLLRLLAVLSLVILILPAQAQVVIDGNFDDWPEESQVDVPPNPPILTFQEGSTFAPGPWNAETNPLYFIDADVSDFYFMEDENYVYFRVDMNPLADVRRLFTDTEMYLGNQRIELFVSVDPDPDNDFQDTTGITWGWYASGYDFRFRLFPFDTTFMEETDYQTIMWEHTQEGPGWFYEQWQGDLTKGIKVAWNDEYNKAEAAVHKSILFNPKNLPGYEPHDVIAVMVTSGATEKDSPWWQEQWSLPGRQGYLLDIEHLPPTSVRNDRELPGAFYLSQNYPNPFNPSTTIEFALGSMQKVTLVVYNMLGQEVERLIDRELTAGQHAVTFNARNLPSGIYFYTLQTGEMIQTKKMVLLK